MSCMCQMKIQYIPFHLSSMLNSKGLRVLLLQPIYAYLKYSIFASLKLAKESNKTERLNPNWTESRHSQFEVTNFVLVILEKQHVWEDVNVQPE